MNDVSHLSLPFQVALFSYLASAVPGAVSSQESLTARKFAHGQSNPTYLLEVTPPGSTSVLLM